jgi:hypothetical protein
MAVFIKKFNKFISKRRPFKGDKKERPRSKSMCYNCGKNEHFVAQCPYKKKKEDNEKKKKFDKGYKKLTKKKPYGQAHIGQEWNSSDESSESKSDDLTTITIKGKASSSKSLFPNLSKHTCLMAKESKMKASHPLRRMIVKVTVSRSVTIAKSKSLVSVKVLSQPSIQFLKFFLLNH